MELKKKLFKQYWLFLAKKKLNKIKTISTNANNLISGSGIDLKGIFGDAEIAKQWEDAKETLSKFDFPATSGGVNKGDRKALYYLMCKFKPASVLEIGTHVGASTFHIAAALNAIHVSKGEKAKLTTVDIVDVNFGEDRPCLKFDNQPSPSEIMDKMNFNFVSFVANTSMAFSESCQDRFDLIFLDGSHDSNMVYQEIPIALKLLTANGIIVLHDYFPAMKPLWADGHVIPGPYLAVKRLVKEGMQAHVMPFGELPWETKLGSKYTSLALLVKN